MTAEKLNSDERKRKLILALAILESTSEDSTDDEILQILIKEKVLRPKHKKRQSLLNSYSEDDFRKEFRMRRDTCSKIIADFQKSPFYPKNDSHGGTPKSSAENHVLSFLKFAGSKTCIRDVAAQFCIGVSTFHRQCGRVMNYLNDIAPSVIKFPETSEEKASISQKFEQIAGLPGVLGCIKSTYIPIRTPANKSKSRYLNHQQQISITLQGICDPTGAFLDVFTGPPSKIHDARVYRLSFIYKRLPEICSGDLHLVGDEAYPLSGHLLTPYDGDQRGQLYHNFNNSLQLSLQPVENAFRHLKQRFRQLSRLDFHQVDTAAKFMISCCVLHNLCIFANDPLLSTDPMGDVEDNATNNPLYADLCSELSDTFELGPVELQSKQLGEGKRDRISTDLWVKLGQI